VNQKTSRKVERNSRNNQSLENGYSKLFRKKKRLYQVVYPQEEESFPISVIENTTDLTS
jgi:hypothetical protein